LLSVLTISVSAINAQTDSDKLLDVMSQLVDQFDKPFDKNIKAELTVAYVPGSDDPLTKVYGKFKDKKQKPANFIFVGSFAEMFDQGFSPTVMRNHVKDGLVERYGKDGFRILLDLESKIKEVTNLKGIAIIKIKQGKKAEIKEYSENRKEFLDIVQTFFEK
jgi:hypothetical protein